MLADMVRPTPTSCARCLDSDQAEASSLARMHKTLTGSAPAPRSGCGTRCGRTRPRWRRRGPDAADTRSCWPRRPTAPRRRAEPGPEQGCSRAGPAPRHPAKAAARQGGCGQHSGARRRGGRAARGRGAGTGRAAGQAQRARQGEGKRGRGAGGAAGGRGEQREAAGAGAGAGRGGAPRAGTAASGTARPRGARATARPARAPAPRAARRRAARRHTTGREPETKRRLRAPGARAHDTNAPSNEHTPLRSCNALDTAVKRGYTRTVYTVLCASRWRTLPGLLADRGPAHVRHPAYLEELTCPCCIPALGGLSEVPPRGVREPS